MAKEKKVEAPEPVVVAPKPAPKPKEKDVFEKLEELKPELQAAVAGGTYAGVRQNGLLQVIGAIDYVADTVWQNKVVGH